VVAGGDPDVLGTGVVLAGGRDEGLAGLPR